MISQPHLISTVVALSVVVLSFFTFTAYRCHRYGAALAAVVCIGAMLRLFAATDNYLHEWDERFHAVVAKNCIQSPLKPMLYRQPAVPYDYRNWLSNHIWLHKPPLSLWLMAASLRLFGTSEFALRLPSLILSCLGIPLMYYLGKLLWRRTAGPTGLIALGDELPPYRSCIWA